jgi:hypothetical protein
MNAFIVSEDMYTSLRVALLERVRDKEPFVRVQAVAALAKICGSEDLEELGEGEQTATEVLEDLLAHDPSACVSPTFTLLLLRTNFSAMCALPHYSTFLSRLKPLLPYSLGRAMSI